MTRGLLYIFCQKNFAQEQLIKVSESYGAAALDCQNPQSPSKKLSYLVGVFAGGNIVATIISMVAGILVARLVNPSVLGLFNAIGLILGYIPFLGLGIANGLNRELPYYIGKNDRTKANDLAAAAQAWLILVGGISAIALIIVAGYYMFHKDFFKAAGWGVHSVLVFLFFFSTTYLQITYRTSHDFARVALINTIQAVFGIVLLVLVWWLNFYGLCLRALFTTIIAAAFFFHWRPVRVYPRWNLQNLKHLLLIGAPIFVVGLIYSYWTVLDRTLVFYYTGTHGMGLYSIVIMATTSLGLLPMALSQIIYPRMAEHYGRSESLDELIKMAVKPMLASALAVATFVAMGWWFVEPVTRLLVPKYVEAVPAIQWALLIPIVMCFQPINNVFNVIRRQALYFSAILFGIGIYYISLLWLIRETVTLVAFPKAMLIGRFTFTIICYLLITIVLRRSND